MADDWHFTRNRNLQGPVSFERLQKLAHEGWLLPTDLVWHVGMTDWIPASDVQGLFGSQMGQLLQRTLLGRDFIDPLETAAAPQQSRVPELPPAPKKLSRRRAQQAKATQVHIAWEQWWPRHVIAAQGRVSGGAGDRVHGDRPVAGGLGLHDHGPLHCGGRAVRRSGATLWAGVCEHRPGVERVCRAETQGPGARPGKAATRSRSRPAGPARQAPGTDPADGTCW